MSEKIPIMKPVQVAKLILRLLIGGMFIAAAVMKLISLDEFEVYIYSFNLFGFVLSTLVARAVIAAELILGAGLIAKICYKQVWWLIQLMLVGFSLLLVYVMLFRHDTNCHCFGDLVELDPAASLIKNIVTFGLMFFIRKEEDYQFKGKKWCVVAIVVVGVVVPFVLFTPDTVYNKFVNSNDKLNVEAYNQALTDSTFCDLQLTEGRYLVGFFASGCQYCRQSLHKVNTIMQNHAISHDNLKYYIWGSEEGIVKFKEETATQDVMHCLISPITAINITFGSFPVYALVENGRVVKSFDYRGIDERDIVAFLKENKTIK